VVDDPETGVGVAAHRGRDEREAASEGAPGETLDGDLKGDLEPGDREENRTALGRNGMGCVGRPVAF
jgi:hypothetical protein